ncbi:MAG: DegT/DnrJ/EryC1/StrS family aminotransferase [Brumimicrobium sp.]
MIPVTKSFLPPMEEYTAQVQRAFDKGWLTNRGELVQELEAKLRAYLGLKETQILCTNNGTVPLQIALKLLGNGGEIITTPFSYVATTAAIVWEHCTPVFVDIDPEHFTIDETKIEAAITDKTTCILATHVFGNPCNIEAIEAIAKKHNLKVIYDAAHCFGVRYKGKSIFEYGDISTCSFHATKLFHTGEGGAIFCKDPELFHKIYYSHNFGHNGPLQYYGLGINGKMSELNAAMGLAVLPYMNEIIEGRFLATKAYHKNLKDSSLKQMKLRDETQWNYSYYPVIFKGEKELTIAEEALKNEGIYPRRYFYPSLTQLPYINNVDCKHSKALSVTILCLPIFYDLPINELSKITAVLKTSIN